MRGLGPWIALAGLFVGGGLAVGLYLARPVAPSSTAPSPPARPIDAAVIDRAMIESTIRSAIDPLRAQWKLACWDRLVKSKPEPPSSRHVLSLAFDARGNEVIRVINDERGATREDMAACLREQPVAPLRIPAITAPTNVDIPLAFP